MKFLLALVVCLCLAWVIHAFALTVYAVSDNGLAPTMKRGNRVIVNRMATVSPQKGDFIVYNDSTRDCLAQVINLPGDTISLQGERYRIPEVCCDRCPSTDCRLFLVKTSAGYRLVYKHQIVGKAFRLF